MNDDFERDPIAQELRASLTRHAADAPRGDMLAERIIHAADQASARASAGQRRRRSFRVWALPLVAAAAVGAVATAVVAVANYHPEHRVVSGASGTVSVSVAPSIHPATSTPASPTASKPTSVPVTDLSQVKVLDLTFVGPNDGWALASARCEAGSGSCTALLHTTDGVHWPAVQHPSFHFNVPGVQDCADPCVGNVRFVNDNVGYAFGPNALFMTSDGGGTWTRQNGLGALALESANGKVMRVFTSRGQLKVATADNGSPNWHDQVLGSAAGLGGQVQLTLNYEPKDPRAYLLAGSTVYRSDDNGASWHPVVRPCAVNGIRAISAGPADRVAVLCHDPVGSFPELSTTAGDGWTPKPWVVPAGMGKLFVGDAQGTLAVGGRSGLATSTDGGRSWKPSKAIPEGVGFLGFENAKVGRAVSADGRTIWTTSNGGRSWSSTVFP